MLSLTKHHLEYVRPEIGEISFTMPITPEAERLYREVAVQAMLGCDAETAKRLMDKPRG